MLSSKHDLSSINRASISLRSALAMEWCRIARHGSGQPGDFDVPVTVVFAAPDRAARRRPIGIGIGAIVVHGSAPTAHNITAHCPLAHDEDSEALAGERSKERRSSLLADRFHAHRWCRHAARRLGADPVKSVTQIPSVATKVDLVTGEETHEPAAWTILPPPADKCQVCAVKYGADEPHNAQSLYYQMTFAGMIGRPPTWADAMAHCEAPVGGRTTEARRMDGAAGR
jgi:hypothetical protein